LADTWSKESRELGEAKFRKEANGLNSAVASTVASLLGRDLAASGRE
jgi:hypothetical protein